VFFVVVVSTLVQGTTLERVANRLGVVDARPVAIEAAQDGAGAFELVDFTVAGDHAVNGSEVRELGLPARALVAAVTRGNATIRPARSTVLEPGDRVLVLVPRSMRADLEDVFARWRRRV